MLNKFRSFLNRQNKFVKGYVFGLCTLALVSSVYAATLDLWIMTGSGSRRSTKEFKIQASAPGSAANFLPGTDNTNALGSSSLAFSNISTYLLSITNTLTVGKTIQFGSASTAISTLTTSGLSYGSLFTATLGGSTAASEGSNLCALAPTGSTIMVQVCPATNNLLTWVGVASAAVSTGSVINVYYDGTVLALTTGTVNTGDALYTTSLAAGYLTTTAISSNSVVAVAMSTGTSAGGLAHVRLR